MNQQKRHAIEDEPYFVVMIEPQRPGEQHLGIAGQINEVFGPFENDTKADEWTDKMRDYIPGREWLVIPLSSPSVINRFNGTN